MITDTPPPGFRRVADRAAALVGEQLVGVEHGDLRVGSVLHYGAVDLDPANLVVWLLLEAPDGRDLPAWLEVTPLLVESMRPPEVPYDWLLRLAEQVQSAFHDAGWPAETPPTVMVDSRSRVEAAGGWAYFR